MNPASPSSLTWIEPEGGTSVHPITPLVFGPDVTKIDQPFTPRAGTTNVTSTVVPGSTTLGVADPTRCPMRPCSVSSATNNLAG